MLLPLSLASLAHSLGLGVLVPSLSLPPAPLPLSLSLSLLSLSHTHSHAHTLLSLFLSAEILYLPPMTFLARGGVGGWRGRRGGGGWCGGRDQRTQPLLLHDFNVLNRHRKSRAHLKNTLRVLSIDVVTELFFPSWSHSCYTLTVFLESYSDESLPSFSPNSFALSPAVSPSSPRPVSRSFPGPLRPGPPPGQAGHWAGAGERMGPDGGSRAHPRCG